MIIRILSPQIPTFWEVIKFSAARASMVREDALPRYLLDLLHSLLNDKAQCFIRYKSQEDKSVEACFVTKILVDKIHGDKYLQIHTVYGFSRGLEESWRRDFNFLSEFAKKNDCHYVGFVSHAKRIWELGRTFGFKELHRAYRYEF